MASTLVLRIKFPVQYPLIYKMLRVESNLTGKEAIQYIAEKVNVTSLLVGTEALYISDHKKWIEDGETLESVKEYLEEVEHIEFKDRNAPPPPSKNRIEKNGCCIIS